MKRGLACRAYTCQIIIFLNRTTERSSEWRAQRGVQILPVGYGNPCRRRTHAYDPQGPVARDEQIASNAAILFAGGVINVVVPGPLRPHTKFATKPIAEATFTVDMPEPRPRAFDLVWRGHDGCCTDLTNNRDLVFFGRH
jgi:hypothetical protein